MARRARRVVLAVALLALLAGGYIYYWHHMAAQLAQGIEAWVASERAAGREVAFDDAPVTGFPFAFRRDFTNVTLHQPVADGTWSIAAASATASMRPWQWREIQVTAASSLTVTFQAPGRVPLALDVTGARGEVLLMPDGRLQRLAIVAGPVLLAHGAESFEAAATRLAVDFPPIMARTHTDPLLGVEFGAEGIILPDGARALTADPISSLGFSATILGPVPRDLPPRQAIARWAESGGTLELKRFNFVQAPLDLSGEGTLALDRNQQVLGALTIRAAGLPETIDLLAAEGLVSGPAVATGRMMAENLAKPDDRGRHVASAALSLQQGFVWLGPIRLAPLPVLTWQ